jgi:RNA polymerase sigma-70 factor (ECF subfamily)
MAIDGFALDLLPDTDRDSQSDSSLIRQLIGGSQDALAGIYDRHAKSVFATAMRVSRDRGIAEEVVQETFLALWNRAERFDPARGTLIAWLATIARNRAIDHLRSAGRHDRAATFSSFDRDGWDDQATVEWLTSTGELIGAAGAESGPELALADKETREVIQDALTSLAPLERQVIELAYGTGMSQSEIAAHLGWPVGTVKTRTRRALRHIRERLEGPLANAWAQDKFPATSRSEPTAWRTAVTSGRSSQIAPPCFSPC